MVGHRGALHWGVGRRRATTFEPVGRAVAALALLALYLFSQPLDTRGGITDVDAATLPAWQFAQTGSYEMSDYLGRNDWYVATDRGIISNRSPGLIGFATLAYLVAAPFTPEYSPVPGVLLAVLASWMAVLFVASAADRLRKGLWFPALILLGLGTPTWAISANQLWPHGPAQLAVAAGVLLLIRQREWAGGASFAAAVLIRPPTVILALGVAAAKAWRDRSWETLVRIGAPPAIAAGAFLAYNRFFFGSWSPVASYEAVGGFYGFEGQGDRLLNVFEAFFSNRHGVLMWSAWIVVCLLFAYLPADRPVPRWLAASPLVAAGYVMVHSLMEVASGAFPYSYRYPLEAVTLASPFLICAIPRILDNPLPRASLLLSGGAAIFLQFSFVFLSACSIVPASNLMACSLFG